MTTNEWFAGGAARAMRGMEWPSCHGSRRVLTRVLSQSCTIVTSTDPTTKTKKTIVVIAPSCEFMRVASEESGISFEKMSSRSAVVLFFRLFSLACQDEWSCSAALHLRRFRRRCRLLTVTNRHGHGGIGEEARRLQAIARNQAAKPEQSSEQSASLCPQVHMCMQRHTRSSRGRRGGGGGGGGGGGRDGTLFLTSYFPRSSRTRYHRLKSAFLSPRMSPPPPSFPSSSSHGPREAELAHSLAARARCGALSAPLRTWAAATLADRACGVAAET